MRSKRITRQVVGIVEQDRQTNRCTDRGGMQAFTMLKLPEPRHVSWALDLHANRPECAWTGRAVLFVMGLRASDCCPWDL